jgi:uncharacterized protein (TIGR03000 family)
MPPAKDVTPPAPKPQTGSTGAAAKVTVELPVDAKLFIDDQLMKATSAKRVFRTPVLDPGQAYFYMVRAEVDRDGKKLTQTKRVIMRPGEDVKAVFTDVELQGIAKAEAEE